MRWLLLIFHLLKRNDTGKHTSISGLTMHCIKRLRRKMWSVHEMYTVLGIYEETNAIGKAPKDKIFKNYIEIELQLGNIDRCRKLYELYLEWSPENCYAWSKYAELERSLDETELARTTFELAISQPALDMP